MKARHIDAAFRKLNRVTQTRIKTLNLVVMKEKTSLELEVIGEDGTVQSV